MGPVAVQSSEALHLLRIGPEGVERWNDWRSQADGELPSLDRANLSGADLRGADLRKLRLVRIDLSQANLQDADLSETNCSEANFAGARLEGAVARSAKLFRVDFTGADLSGANLAGAYLGESLLLDVKLLGTDLTNVRGLRLSQLESVEIDARTILPPSLRDEYATLSEKARQALPAELRRRLE